MKQKTQMGSSLAVLMLASLLIALLALSTAYPVMVSQAQGNQTPGPTLSTPVEDQEGTPIPATPRGSVSGGRVELPPTLEELLEQNPDLKAYLDKVGNLKVGDYDFAELYAVLAALFNTRGAAGVGVFLEESGLLETLNIPHEYIDLLLEYDKTGLPGVEAKARQWQLINEQDELRGFLLIDADENEPAVRAALEGLGVSAYEFNVNNTGELEIGIPLELLAQYQTPGTLLGFFVSVGTLEHVEGFRVPRPMLTPRS